jgi:very-short-patch-repair endonuclease
MNRDEDELKSRGLVNTGFHLPYNPDLIKRAKWLRKNMTLAEKKLWYNFLRKYSMKIFRQRPIDHFIVDFYCPKVMLVIEIDGDDHHSDDRIEYDRERTSILEGYGLRVIRFKNEEVLNQFRDVCRKLEGFFAPPQ